ncbi:protein FAR1-RELATED SEQUENCE 5-like [Chenopodium quinoa]|uniref:protein FAR1-RELATED SEQUENCE 5-like n=1 Tax=Chenopodium quinoa TaxID=63459 RepID=UPI000B774EDE|nr:protein FAR1-RELATED SEQUENCE 5-like [Chenopodium quinoa]
MDNVRPSLGMIFNNLDEGAEFYKRYAHNIGFSVRSLTGVKDKKTGFVIWKYFLCSKEGYNQPTNQSMNGGKSKRLKETREGCGAKIKIKRTKEGKYEIKEFVEHHTHALATPTKRHLLRSTRKVNSMHKAVLFTCSRANIGPAKAYQLIKHQVGGYDKVGCTQKDLQNYQTGLKIMISDYDAQMFKENFERKKELDPSYYFAYEVDDEHRLKYFFWADGIGRKNYATFGDIVSFDTTYGTNKYSMIFAPFTGRNHHRQCITFGAAFLCDEKTESFTWLFEKFLEAMGETPEEFEHSWTQVVNEFELTKNEWFSSMYEIRHSWIPAYFKDLFLAGLFRTTSISKSENSVFGSLTDKWLNLVEFWVRYESIIDRQRHNQKKSDHDTSHSLPILKTNHSIEKHARDIYTHANFYVFQKETKEENGSIIFEVMTVILGNQSKELYLIILWTMWLIAHGRGIDAIPSYYIVHRWTKSATCSLIFDMDTVVDEGCSQIQLANIEISELWKDFHGCAELVGYDIDKIRVLRNGIIDFKKSLLESTNVCVDNKTNDLEAYVESTIPVKIDIHPPKHSITKGSGKRIPSGKEKAIEDKQKRQRLCKSCGKYAQHDSRNCPMKEA